MYSIDFNRPRSNLFRLAIIASTFTLYACGGSSGFATGPRASQTTASETDQRVLTVDEASSVTELPDSADVTPATSEQTATPITPVFTPASGTQFAESGTILISGIKHAEIICLSFSSAAQLSRSTPSLFDGLCMGEDVQQLHTPSNDLNLSMACDDILSAPVQTRTIQLTISDQAGAIY